MRAARFVQDEIRYVGIEVGIARRKASNPNLTFQRRYGDCKDKTALLVALLRAAQLQADPVLVSSTHGRVLDASAPSGSVFDHAIVRVNKAGLHYFIDPTSALQGGGVERFTHSPFGKVLVLTDESSRLETLTPEPQNEPSLSISDRLHLNVPSSRAEATLDTVRTYRGFLADAMRAQLRSMSPEQRSKTYLGIYQPDYADIHELAPIDEADDRANDVLRVSAHFGVPNVWVWNQRELRQVAKASARALQWLLPSPSSNDRSVPLATPFPLRGRQEIEIELPFDLPKLSSSPERITTNATWFSFDSSYANRHLTYFYEVTARARAVAPEDMQQQRSAVEKALTLMHRTVLYREGLGETGWRGVNWLIVPFACLVLAVSGALSWWAFRARKTIANTRRRRGAPAAFAGWLAFFALGVLAMPIVLAFDCFQDLRVVLSLQKWQALTTPGQESYRPGLAAILLGATTFRLSILSYSFTVVAALLKKLRSFPWHFTVFAPSLAGFTIAESVALACASNTPGDIARFVAPARAVIYCAVWITYLQYSRRVAFTFTNGPRKVRVRKTPDASIEPAAEREP